LRAFEKRRFKTFVNYPGNGSQGAGCVNKHTTLCEYANAVSAISKAGYFLPEGCKMGQGKTLLHNSMRFNCENRRCF